MALRFKANGSGKVAIFEPPDDVFSNPLIDLDRVVFHTNFPFLSVVKTMAGTLLFPRGGQFTGPLLPLGNHDQIGVPAFIGAFIDFPSAGLITPWAGTVPIYQGAPYPNVASSFGIWLTLYADKNQIYAHPDGVAPLVDVAVKYVVHIFDQIMEA